MEDGSWLFWDARGEPLHARFLNPNYRGAFGIGSGAYQLLSTRSLPPLREALTGLSGIEPNAFFQSIAALQEHLAAVTPLPQHGC